MDNALDPRQIAAARLRPGRPDGPGRAARGSARAAAGAARAGTRGDGHRGHGRRTPPSTCGTRPRMKDVLQAAGVPCARHSLVSDPGEARSFAGEVGFPLVAKPPAGAGSQATYRLDDGSRARGLAARAMPPSPEAPALLEEFLVGRGAHLRQRDRGRHDGVVIDRRLPPAAARRAAQPLDPVDRAAAARHHRAGVRRDPRGRPGRAPRARGHRRPHAHGVVPPPRRVGRGLGGRRRVPPERSSRPCTATRTTSTCTQAWARLVVLGTFDVPERRFAAGTAYLRGMGRGRVRAVHGVEEVQRQVGHLVVESRLPRPGQPASLGLHWARDT